MRREVTPSQWRALVKEYWIQRGKPWDACQACTVVREQEYYEDLVAQYKAWMRLFPYHLSDYVCRVARVTPFKYYLDMMTAVLKDERSYDKLPNFTAADALSVLGIGRNEYIATLNACKARRLLWRVNINREGIVRENLPQEQTTSQRLEPWWRVAVVNIGESEYRELGAEELAVLKTAALDPAAAGGDIRVRDFQPDVLRGLLRKGLAYLEVPVLPSDRFAIPPLEGFVSNKTSDAGDAAADPLESLLYSVFVANSERMTVAELGAILGVQLQELQAAIGVACRLGFATRMTDVPLPTPAARVPVGISRTSTDDDDGLGLDASGPEDAGPTRAGGGGSDADGGAAGAGPRRDAAQPGLAAEGPGGLHGAQRGPGAEGGVAVVVDAEATGYLMMGALSPGLKRHAVTLFEGGRVAGEEVVTELLQELWASCAASQSFEGEMLRLTHYAAALACLLEAVRASAGPGVPLELLRKESLAGLPPAAVYRVLTHAYCAVVPISPLPPPALPLTPDAPGPAYYGATLEAASPWLNLALYSAARCGPPSFVFVCGQRVWRLPHPLDRCSHALLTPWDDDVDPARQMRAHASEGQTTLVESAFLLHTLNDLLCRTAVLVQPLEAHHTHACPDLVDVPLPLPRARAPPATAAAAGLREQGPAARAARCGSMEVDGAARLVVQGVRRRTGEGVPVVLEAPLVAALRQLGLAACVGYLRMLRMRAEPDPSPGGHYSGQPQPGAAGGYTGPQPHPQPPEDSPPQGSAGGAAAPGSGAHGANLTRSLTGSAAAPRSAGGETLRHSQSYSYGYGHSGASGKTSGSVPESPGSHSAQLHPQPHRPQSTPQWLGRTSETGQLHGQQPSAQGAGGAMGELPFDSGSSPAYFGGAAHDDINPWLPLSVQLGVPLHSLELCRAVCRAASAANFLSVEGRAAQLQAHQNLHTHLLKLMSSYTHLASAADGGGNSAPVPEPPTASPPSTSCDGTGQLGGGSAGWGWMGVEVASGVVSPGSSTGSVLASSGGGSTGAGGRLLGSVLPLPALNLSFDGHSLQPIRLRDCVQGLGCVCQG